ncbi:MAG: hypothetical protein RSF88_03945 [Lachnospiraceae bacterium]
MKSIKETIQAISKKKGVLTDAETQFIIQYAFKTGDEELILKMIEDFTEEGKDSKALIQKYEATLDVKPKWVDQIENLLVAIEMYRLEEEKAVNRLADVLGAYGIHVTAEEIRNSDMEQIKQKVKTL